VSPGPVCRLFDNQRPGVPGKNVCVHLGALSTLLTVVQHGLRVSVGEHFALYGERRMPFCYV
jgi:hypothetical protein